MLSIKKVIQIFVLSAVIFTAVNPATAQRQALIVKPVKPQPGESVTITYHPDASDAEITNPDSLMLVRTFRYRPYAFSVPYQLEMKKIDNSWSASFKLPKYFTYSSFYFKSGKNTDKNKKGNFLEIFAYKNGIPVEGAFLMKASHLKSIYENADQHMVNSMKADLYAKALDTHPKSFEVRIRRYAFLLSQKSADSTFIKKQALELLEKNLKLHHRSLKWIKKIKRGYNLIGESAKADSVEQAMIEKYPKSDVGWYAFYERAMKVEDLDKQAQMLLKYVNANYNRSRYNKLQTETAYKKLLQYFAKKGNVERMKKMASIWVSENEKFTKQYIYSSKYNTAAQIIAKNTQAYKLALQYAHKALNISDDEPTALFASIYGTKVVDLPKKRRMQNLKDRKSSILSTIGLIYIKQKRFDKAEQILKRAKRLSADKTTYLYLAKLYRQTNRSKQAFNIYWKLLLDEPLNQKLRKKFRESYITYRGSTEGLEQKTKKLDSLWREAMVKKFQKKMMDKEAPSLAHLKDLQGHSIDLSTLKNKVIVIDFWATWCLPCMQAFPYIQNVYEKYNENKNVKFFIVNSAMRNTLKDARKWKKEGTYAEKDYTFPLYYDKDSKVTKAFGVYSLPTTVVLGKDGKIKFKHIGFAGPMYGDKLNLRIEMLLDNNMK